MASTGVTPQESTAFRRGVNKQGRRLTTQEEEDMIKKHLPPPPDPSSTSISTSPIPRSKDGKRTASQSHQSSTKHRNGHVRHALHVLIFTIMHFCFSVYIRFRQAWHFLVYIWRSIFHYHHRTPEYIQRDTERLDRLPEHLSVIIDFHESDEEQGNAGLEGLVNDVCSLVAWSASAGIPFLSIYEKRGILKNMIPQVHESISDTLESWFGPSRKPTLSVRAPHLPSYSPPPTPPSHSKKDKQHINVLLLSATDGRPTMVDLTKTLAEMAQKDSLKPDQINADLIDAELKEAVSTDPDLLILFSPTIELKGYPPWQLRLTEIFHVPDNKGVNYQVFIRALYNFCNVEQRFGK